jgi:VWFA-related protein
MPVTVGVAVMKSAAKEAPGIEARDRLVKALNRSKQNKQVSVNAIPLEASLDTPAIAEAKAKQCQFVLSTGVTNLEASSSLTFNGAAGLDYVPLFLATVEYRLTRTSDGALFAPRSVQGEDLRSVREAVWQAIADVAEKALADLETGGDAPKGLAPPSANQPAPALQQQVYRSAIDPNYCAWLPADVPHSEALRGVCEYSVSLPVKMPNMICDQAASRYRGKGRVAIDLVTSLVTYEDGDESYSSINVNGTPLQAALGQSPGLWSTGQFSGNNLRSVFSPRNQAAFKLSRESALSGHSAWVFTYQIAKQNDPLWRLHGANQMVAPSYKGELWIDQKTGQVLRFQSIAKDLPSDFSMTGAELRIDYEDVPFADGSSFVLPVEFAVTTGNRAGERTRNVVQIKNCHKFRAHGRVVASLPGTSSEETSSELMPEPAIEAQLQENKQINEILSEQWMREDDARREIEQHQHLNEATGRALSKLVALDKELHDTLARQPVAANAPPSAAKDQAAVATLRVRVNLVQVTVVLRDSKGHAVGGRRKEDFRLFDDRRPQQITSFSVEPSGAAKPEQASARPNPSPVQPSPENHALTPPATERDVAYVFDDVHGSSGELANLRDAAKRHLASLRTADRAAIITASGEVQVDFTGNHEKLLLALEKLRAHPTMLGSNCPPVSYYMSNLMVNDGDLDTIELAVSDTMFCAFGGIGTPQEMGQAQSVATDKAFQVLNAGNRDSRQTLSVLADVIRRTAAMPGQRSIILVSPGFLTLEPDLRQSVMELIDRAIASDIVINTLDVRGLYSPGMDASLGHSTNPTLRLQLDTNGATAQSDVMFEVANGTGGTFFQHNNDLDEGFRRTAAAPEYVYVLGFSPQKLDGKFHQLKVTLASAGKLTVQARQGYYAAKPAN